MLIDVIVRGGKQKAVASFSAKRLKVDKGVSNEVADQRQYDDQDNCLGQQLAIFLIAPKVGNPATHIAFGDIGLRCQKSATLFFTSANEWRVQAARGRAPLAHESYR